MTTRRRVFDTCSQPVVADMIDPWLVEADTLRMRQTRPFVFTNLKSGEGVEPIAEFIVVKGGLETAPNYWTSTQGTAEGGGGGC